LQKEPCHEDGNSESPYFSAGSSQTNTYLLYTQSFVDYVLAKGSLSRPARADYSHQQVVDAKGVSLPVQ
jgi:5'-nucleotidase